MLNSEIKRDDRGVDRCSRTVMKAVHNVPNDDSKGFHNIPSICSMPIVQRISDGVKGCPHCDKEPAVGNVHPRVTSASQVALTAKELQECGVENDPSLIKITPKKAKKVVQEKKAVEAKVNKAKKDVVEFAVTLDLLEQAEDLPRLLIKSASEGLDKLPVTNFAESKRLLRLQEKLERLLVA